MTSTWYRHAREARRGLRVTHTREELAASLAHPMGHPGAKADLPLICFATFQGDHRGNERAEHVHVLGLDIDEPQADPTACIAAIATALGGVEIFAYSTFSSAPGAFKLRALVPYDRPATGDEHRSSWAMVARLLARAGVFIDRACSDPARGFYVWAVPPSGAYYHAHLDGASWPVSLAAEAETERLAKEARTRSAEAVRRRALRPASRLSTVECARRYVAAMPPAISGAGGHAATFDVARRLAADFELADDDALEILREYSERCSPPWLERELRHKLESAKSARVRVPMTGPR